MNHNEPLESDEWGVNPTRKKKDTKRWCKGKLGREHTLVTTVSTFPFNPPKCGTSAEVYSWVEDTSPFRDRWICRHERKCSTCGKVVKYTLPKDECPEG